jgi:hypothetical protein
MKTSESINELAAALAKAQASMKNAKLNKTNPHFKSRYADLAEIRDTVTPALAANGIAVVHGMDALDGGGLVVVTRLIHSSGQWIESRFPIAYDKPQTMGSAITYGRRYNLSAITNIAADDDDDANAANDKPAVAPHAKPEAMPSVNGTAGASKAGSRAAYEKMISSIRSTSTLKMLDEWYKANVADIDKLPSDWLDELRMEYVDRQSDLKKQLAA